MADDEHRDILKHNPLLTSPASGGGTGSAELTPASELEVCSTETPHATENITCNAESTPAPFAGRAGEGSGETWSYWRTTPELWEKIKPLACQMRHNPTPAENHLWQRLRRKQIGGYKFRRQHTIDRFIVDFYCPEARLIIEVDGPIHEYSQEEDMLRTAFLESLGLRVVRFRNGEVLRHTQAVVERIGELLELPPKTPS